jgi:hypothetical protein
LRPAEAPVSLAHDRLIGLARRGGVDRQWHAETTLDLAAHVTVGSDRLGRRLAAAVGHIWSRTTLPPIGSAQDRFLACQHLWVGLLDDRRAVAALSLA